MKTFHCTSFVITCSMVTILGSAAIFMPAPSGVAVAHASFPAVDGQANPNHRDSRAELTEDVTNLDLQTASGPADGADLQDRLNWDLQAVLQGTGNVPRLILASLPDDLELVGESQTRKAMFLKAVLPLVLQVNEQILQDRQRLQDLAVQQKASKPLAAVDRLWLAAMAERYDTERDDLAAMLYHHDVVPPSLALAQAATESAWGSSRFVREGNAMFGQWTFSSNHLGIVPSERDTDKTHRVRAFASLTDSVTSYVENLNKHRAYKEYRAMRAAMRSSDRPLDGLMLAETLHRYSERGMAYVDELHMIITSNNLSVLDGAQLSETASVEPLI
jgi:Bax protein